MPYQRFPPMWADFGRARADALADLPVETVRIAATVLLVAYHVVGSGPEAGLHIDYPHATRIVVDLLRDLRMPLFAFIAGLVFALRPIASRDLSRFFAGKVRRLLLPGAVAVGLSAVATTLVDAQNAHEGPVWHLAVYPYMHYWFLMAMLVIFAVYAPLDAITRGRALLPALGLSIALSLGGWLHVFDIWSVNGAIYLAPYFLLGAAFLRHRDEIAARFGPVMLAAAIAVALGLALQVSGLAATGEVPADRRDLQSLAMGFGICILAMSFLPRLPLLDRFGPYAFTIYLYHVFALAGCRQALHAVGIESLWINFVLGVACAMCLPVALHMVVERSNLLRVALLGLRPRRKVASVNAREAARGEARWSEVGSS